MLEGELKWFHVTVGTYASWLPGDPRGFRSRSHRLHSSGDHRHPPPPGEHAGLHAYAQDISGERVVIPRELRPVIGRALVRAIQRDRRRVAVLSVGGVHAHLFIELPEDSVDSLMGEYKRQASCAVTKQMPGRLWAKKCGVEPVRSGGHATNVGPYIENHVKEGHWVWTEDRGELPYML